MIRMAFCSAVVRTAGTRRDYSERSSLAVMALEGAVRSALQAWTPILATTAPVTLLNSDLKITFDILDTSASKENRVQYFFECI